MEGIPLPSHPSLALSPGPLCPRETQHEVAVRGQGDRLLPWKVKSSLRKRTAESPAHPPGPCILSAEGECSEVQLFRSQSFCVRGSSREVDLEPRPGPQRQEAGREWSLSRRFGDQTSRKKQVQAGDGQAGFSAPTQAGCGELSSFLSRLGSFVSTLLLLKSNSR